MDLDKYSVANSSTKKVLLQSKILSFQWLIQKILKGGDFRICGCHAHLFPILNRYSRKFVTNLNNFTLENDYYSTFLVAGITYENYEYH